MLACGCDGKQFGDPVCIHLRQGQPWLPYVKWYTGTALDLERLCLPCVEERERGTGGGNAGPVCEECFDHATGEVGDLVGVRGRAGIVARAEALDDRLRRTALPVDIGTVVDFAPIDGSDRSTWLLLAEGGDLLRLDADSGDWLALARTTVPAEPGREPWAGHRLRRRLHVSADGGFAAVVNDYGRLGQVIDLRSGEVTLALDGGEYHPETVPFSFAFAEAGDR